jgi:hypothetical protein
MYVDEPTAALLTRVTARISAVLFIVWLLRQGWLRWRGPLQESAARAQRKLFLTFAAAHIIHLAALLLLAQVTQGESIGRRGGWLRVVLTGGVVYLAIVVMAAAHLGLLPGAARIRDSLGAEMIVTLLIWIAFMQAYTGRAIESAYYWPFPLLLTGGMLFYLIGARLRPVAEARSDS